MFACLDQCRPCDGDGEVERRVDTKGEECGVTEVPEADFLDPALLRSADVILPRLRLGGVHDGGSGRFVPGRGGGRGGYSKGPVSRFTFPYYMSVLMARSRALVRQGYFAWLPNVVRRKFSHGCSLRNLGGRVHAGPSPQKRDVICRTFQRCKPEPWAQRRMLVASARCRASNDPSVPLCPQAGHEYEFLAT